MSKETLNAETFFKEREPQAFEVLLPNHINLISELMEAYHKAKVNAITDEEIEEYVEKNITYDFEGVLTRHMKEALENSRKSIIYGAKWFKNRLLNG